MQSLGLSNAVDFSTCTMSISMRLHFLRIWLKYKSAYRSFLLQSMHTSCSFRFSMWSLLLLRKWGNRLMMKWTFYAQLNLDSISSNRTSKTAPAWFQIISETVTERTAMRKDHRLKEANQINKLSKWFQTLSWLR